MTTQTAETPLYRVSWKNSTGQHEEICCESCFRHIGWAQPKPLNWMTTPAQRTDEPVAYGDCGYCEYRRQSEDNFIRRNAR